MNDPQPLPVALSAKFWKQRGSFAAARLLFGLELPTVAGDVLLNPTRLLTKLGLVGVAVASAGSLAARNARAVKDSEKPDITDGVEVAFMAVAAVNTVGLGLSVASLARTLTAAHPSPAAQSVHALLLAGGGALSYLPEVRPTWKGIRELRATNETRRSLGSSGMGIG